MSDDVLDDDCDNISQQSDVEELEDMIKSIEKGKSYYNFTKEGDGVMMLRSFIVFWL